MSSQQAEVNQTNAADRGQVGSADSSAVCFSAPLPVLRTHAKTHAACVGQPAKLVLMVLQESGIAVLKEPWKWSSLIVQDAIL